jgi:peptide/nickel transport system substrate-binding protein
VRASSKLLILPLLVLAVSVGVVLAACGAAEQPAPQAPAAPAPAQPPQPAAPAPTQAPMQPQQPAPAAPAATAIPLPTAQPVPTAPIQTQIRRPTPLPAGVQPKTGGTMRIVSVGSVQSFDPLWTTASSTYNVANSILEAIFAQTADYGMGPVLADSWNLSPDGMKWTIKIRDGVKFHDGTPLTTKEVVGTLRRQQDRANVFRLVKKDFSTGNFDEMVRAEDNLTFSVNLKEPSGLVIDAVGGAQGFAPRIVTEKWYTVSAEQSAQGEPIGTGPYKFEAWTPGDRWSMVRYTDYKPHPSPADGQAGGHRAYIDRIVWLEIPDQTTRVAALQVGEVDLAQEFPPDLLPRLERDPNIELYDTAALRLLGHFNHIRPPFDKREARQAVVIGYDNQKALLAAVGDPKFMRLCPSLMQCGTKWESTAGAEGFYNVHDLARAKELIKQAGVEGATVRLMDPTDRQPAHGAAQVTREVLTDLGFKVDFLVMDWATMVSRRARPDDWEFFHTWSGIGVRGGPVGHLQFGELQYDAWFNEYRDVPGTQRQLFSQLARATKEEDQRRIMDEFQKYFYEDAIFLQIGEFFNRWAARAAVKGLHSGAGGQEPYDKWLER